MHIKHRLISTLASTSKFLKYRLISTQASPDQHPGNHTAQASPVEHSGIHNYQRLSFFSNLASSTSYMYNVQAHRDLLSNSDINAASFSHAALNSSFSAQSLDSTLFNLSAQSLDYTLFNLSAQSLDSMLFNLSA